MFLTWFFPEEIPLEVPPGVFFCWRKLRVLMDGVRDTKCMICPWAPENLPSSRAVSSTSKVYIRWEGFKNNIDICLYIRRRLRRKTSTKNNRIFLWANEIHSLLSRERLWSGYLWDYQEKILPPLHRYTLRQDHYTRFFLLSFSR